MRHAVGVDDDYLYGGSYELEVATKRVPCRIEHEALYDPQMERIRG